ncbi:MAG: hypothetical protein V4604_14215 [Bacteroidota bacterium]
MANDNMDLRLIGKAKDLRTNSHIIYGQIGIQNYLALIGDNFDKYGIQRKREKHRAYKRMKEDIKVGALLPTITLAINQDKVQSLMPLIDQDNQEQILKILSVPGTFSILDGLQRTNILKDLKDEGHVFIDNQQLLLEFWIEPDIKHLIYRLIVLNAGQKPMSMRHQIELLFMTLATKLQESIEGLEIFKETEERRRSRAGQYQFERVVTSYQSFLWKTAELNKNNIITQQIMEESVLDSNEEQLNDSFETFSNYLQLFVTMDRAYFSQSVIGSTFPDPNWLANENVMNSFFAAIADFSMNTDRTARINTAINCLISDIESQSIEDPFGITTYRSILTGIDTKKLNVGVATRKLLFSGFKEYFREEGLKKLKDCWMTES